MKVFIKKYGSLVVSLIFLSLSILKLVSIGTLFDEESAVVGLFVGGFSFFIGSFFGDLFVRKSKSSADPEA